MRTPKRCPFCVHSSDEEPAAAANEVIVKVGEGCMCILETVGGRVGRNTLACSHSKTVLF